MSAFFQSFFVFDTNFTVFASENGLTQIKISDEEGKTDNPNQFTQNTKTQLIEYFDKKRENFDIPLDFEIGTDFQKSVWQALIKIPFGKTISYLDLSKRLKNEKAIRAVGAANGKNPIPIIVPCHRVIGSDGSLTGYALGLKLKRELLLLEGAISPDLFD